MVKKEQIENRYWYMWVPTIPTVDIIEYRSLAFYGRIQLTYIIELDIVTKTCDIIYMYIQTYLIIWYKA